MRGGSKPSFSWKWSKGDAMSSDFGAPSASASADYALCLYDGAGQLLTQLRAPGSGFCGGRPCWRVLGNGGFKYTDGKEGTPDGVTNLSLKPGTGKAKLAAKGRGSLLTLPGLPVSDSSNLRVQLRRAGATPCWESVYTPPFFLNDGDRFRDETP
jgi:hypothetical protein